MKNRLDGFTLVEVIITILVSSIIVLVTYNGILVANKTLLDFKSTHATGFDYILLDGLIRNEVFNSDSLELIHGKKLLIYTKAQTQNSLASSDDTVILKRTGNNLLEFDLRLTKISLEENKLLKLEFESASGVEYLQYHLK